MTDPSFGCGRGVFVLTQVGGWEPRPMWQSRIDGLCAAVSQATGPGGEVRYHAYSRAEDVTPGVPRLVGLDVCGPRGCVYMSISVSPRGNPCVLGDRDLPSLSLNDVQPGTELEFWMANESDTLCLAARLLAALDQDATFTPESSFGTSTNARWHK